jgi:tetratricopeptide (TPR) repeat protein
VYDAGVGRVSHPVSTKNPQAQKFFNQGLAYVFAFNHQEAVRSFKRAAELDPKLAMAYWGVALALGSNYNLEADSPQLREAYTNLQQAIALAPKASARDQAYIEALSHRYAADPETDRKLLASAYKAAMSGLVKKYPNDLDAATLYAESMMNLHPWQLWSVDGKPAENTLEIVSVLEAVLKRNPNHTGANHYYIHAVEASPNPERGLPSARRLGGLAPSAGHLVHMPSHIYIRTGDYEKAAQANSKAVTVDEKYIKQNGAEGVYPAMYYNHNVHFLASVSSMNGNYAEAIRRSRQLEGNVKPMLKMMPMLENFAAYPLTTLVRFEKWDEILREPEPDKDATVVSSLWHFARGIALARTGKPADAERELTAMRDSVNRLPVAMPIGNNAAVTVLKVPDEILTGEIALANGDKSAAALHLTNAVTAHDALIYDEPPDWDLPTREFLGRMLLLNGEYSKAETVYRAELLKHPHNGRALHGLSESLKKQNKSGEAAKIDAQLKIAWAHADTKL